MQKEEKKESEIKPDISKKRKASNAQNETVEQILKKISGDFADVEPLNYISKTLNVNEGYVILGGFILLFFPIIVGFYPQFFVGLLGMLYPGYISLCFSQRKDIDYGKQWLSYWVVFSLLEIIDEVLCCIFSSFLPFFYPVKALFLIWLFYPKSKGATLIYEKAFRKLFKVLKTMEGETGEDPKTENFFKQQ